ncbi:MAG: hypothetical protein ACKOTB_05275, partial [Planctomycetia bacterium]
MERRYVNFLVVSLAIVLGGQLLQAWLFPKPPRKPNEQAAVEAARGDGAVAAPPAAAAAASSATEPASGPDSEPAVEDAPAPRQRYTLGSLDPEAGVGMLVTLTSQGAAVERIELADGRFLDQDDRSGYLGHLACESVAGAGARIGVVGPATFRITSPTCRPALSAG